VLSPIGYSTPQAIGYERIMRNSLTLGALGALAACVMVFIAQNRAILELRFLLWDFEARRAYVVLAVLFAGFIGGWITATVSQLSARSKEAASERENRPARGRRSPPR